jgi:hypothetical protein
MFILDHDIAFTRDCHQCSIVGIGVFIFFKVKMNVAHFHAKHDCPKSKKKEL